MQTMTAWQSGWQRIIATVKNLNESLIFYGWVGSLSSDEVKSCYNGGRVTARSTTSKYTRKQLYSMPYVQVIVPPLPHSHVLGLAPFLPSPYHGLPSTFPPPRHNTRRPRSSTMRSRSGTLHSGAGWSVNSGPYPGFMNHNCVVCAPESCNGTSTCSSLSRAHGANMH